VTAPTTTALQTFLLRRADDNLVLAQRLSEWISRGPDLEEDIALGNLALDHLGVARACLAYVGDLDRPGRSEDDLAFGRTEREYTNLVLCEQPNGDFARTMTRQLFMDAFHTVVWDRLSTSNDPRLAGIAGKAAKETAYHLRHSGQWVIRLGDGTDESRRRMEDAVSVLWRHVGELFAFDDVDEAHLGPGPDVATEWRGVVADVFTEATLELPELEPVRLDGRNGLHSEALGHLLAEMQWMQRTYPGLTW
jgi:ring-1,2-phenylacetyl-CoA epoxidase subunit PaaC